MQWFHAGDIRVLTKETTAHIITFSACCIECAVEFRFQVKPDIPLFENLTVGDIMYMRAGLRETGTLYHHRYPFIPAEKELQECDVVIFGNFVENDLELMMKRIGVHGDRIIMSSPLPWLNNAPAQSVCWSTNPAQFFKARQLTHSFVFGFSGTRV
jgi:hypothetical protein